MGSHGEDCSSKTHSHFASKDSSLSMKSYVFPHISHYAYNVLPHCLTLYTLQQNILQYMSDMHIKQISLHVNTKTWHQWNIFIAQNGNIYLIEYSLGTDVYSIRGKLMCQKRHNWYALSLEETSYNVYYDNSPDNCVSDSACDFNVHNFTLQR